MAYGVKYRLEFSDVLGYGKKVEILKKDYTGEILPMIGTGEPVSIKWNSKDDFYTSIIGSSCQLNLIVTDEIQYDDFFRFDEREYKIKVSYSKSISETFSDRVVADGGIFESLECIDNVLGYFNDGSINYADYWVGFLVVDRYKEQMSSFPYNISLNAFDGLGTLGNYTAPISDNDDLLSGDSILDKIRISQILQNLSLELDIVFINDLNFKDGETLVKYPNVTTFQNYLYELTNGFDLYTAKNQLTLLLTMYNMRIFQSKGKWFIVENSNVFDNSVKENIISLNESENPPLNIRELITKRLKSVQNEFLKAERFNYLGGLQSVENISTLKIAPKELRPINNDLIREYLQPFSEVQREFSTTQLEKTYWNNNAGFEYGSFNWNIIGANAQIVENEISKKGNHSIKLNTLTSSDYKCFITKKIPYESPFVPGLFLETMSSSALKGTKFTFSYFIETFDSINSTTINFKILFYDNSNTIYWDNFNSVWTGTNILNSISVNNFNSWQNTTGSLKDNITGINIVNGKLELEIWSTRTSSGTVSNYINTYLDDVGLFQNGARFQEFIYTEVGELKITPTKKIKSTRLVNSNYSTKKSFETILFPEDTDSMIKKWYRSRDYNFINGDTIKFDSLSNIVNQNVMNDFRDFCIRYEGTFRGLNPRPLSLHNKVWFDWTGVLEDEQSSVIDGLVYNVKSNKYKVTAHVPNDDNDLDVFVQITD